MAAARLARAGLKTLVLERRPMIGGAAITEELHPGFRLSTLAHAAQPDASVLTELRLAEHGLELIDPDPYLFAPLPDGRSLRLSRDAATSAASIRQFSERDARRYSEFRARCHTRGLVRVLEYWRALPPDIEHSTRGDIWALLKLARRLRGLGKKDAYRLLRWAPMSAADFVSEWFESEPLRAVVGARGIFGTALGPRSAGSTAVLLMQMATGGGVPRFVRGGLGAFYLGAGVRGACGGREHSHRC